MLVMSKFTSQIFPSLAILGFVAGMTTALGAGGAFAAGTHYGGHGHGTAIGEPGKASQASKTIEVTAGDNFYEPEKIEVKAGETIRFVITNTGEVVHDFTLGTAAMHAAHQKEMAMMVEHGVIEGDRINRDRMKMDMGGGRTMEHNDPNSALLEPGQTAEIVWKFTEPMTLEFACNVPGHYESGMMGSIKVGK